MCKHNHFLKPALECTATSPSEALGSRGTCACAGLAMVNVR